MFEASHLDCIRSDQIIFRDLTFSVQPGNWIWVKGANGSGKTSLLQILSGLSPSSRGDLAWQTKKLKRLDRDFLAELLYLGHVLALNLYLTPLENLSWWMQLHSPLDSQAKNNLILRTLSEFGLDHLAHLACENLSFGQRQRVSLARLKLKKALFWLLDEPLTGLDESGKHWLANTLQAHLNKGGAFVMASHEVISELQAPQQILDLDRYDASYRINADSRI